MKIVVGFAKCLTCIMLVLAVAAFMCVWLRLDYGLRANALEVPPKPGLISFDIYTQEGGKGSGSFGGSFLPGENVVIYVEHKKESVPVENHVVTIEIVGPLNSCQNISAVLRVVTNSSGIGSEIFTVPLSSECAEGVYGTWLVQSQTGLDIETVGDTVNFEVAFVNPEFPTWAGFVLVLVLYTGTTLALTCAGRHTNNEVTHSAVCALFLFG